MSELTPLHAEHQFILHNIWYGPFAWWQIQYNYN